MDTESYRLTMEVLLDAIKILGPAIITGLVAYHAARLQFKEKIKQLALSNQYAARAKLFEFHKEKIDKNDESLAAVTNMLGQLAGLVSSDIEEMTWFSNGYLYSLIEGLPFRMEHIHKELRLYTDEFKHELDTFEDIKQRASKLVQPKNKEEAQRVCLELLHIYGFLGHCIWALLEKEALKMFAQYTQNT